MHSISLNAEPVFWIGTLPITNAVLATWLLMLVVTGIAIGINRAITQNGRGFFGGLALLLEELFGILEDILGWQAVQQLGPLLATFFLVIILGNWMGLLPGFGALTWGGTPVFRGATTDLHFTLALALISVIAIQTWGLREQGITYLKKYINFSGPFWMVPINVFVGLLEIVSELAKVLSFSLRLFGNIFAGEVLLSVMLGLVPILVPSAFYGLELFVGFIQAFVFMMLTAVFLKLAGEAHSSEH